MTLYKRCGCGKKPYERHTTHIGNWIYDYYENGRGGAEQCGRRCLNTSAATPTRSGSRGR